MRLLIPIIMLAGCAQQPVMTTTVRPAYPAAEYDSRLQTATESAIRSIMRDPESARFGPAAAVKTPTGYTLCGKVNGKNAFGGYTGDKPFMLNLADDLSMKTGSIADDEISVIAHIKVCGEYGLRL
jgi:hypothetical protein